MKNFTIFRNSRKINFTISGLSDGTKILFINGAGMDGSLSFDENILKKNKVQLIALDRPGFGGSDFDPMKSFDSISQDVKCLIDKLGVSSIKAIAFSQGAPFLYKMCLDGLVEKGLIISGQDDLNHPEIFELLDENTKGFINLLINDFESLSESLKNSFNVTSFMDFIISNSSKIDQELYESKSFYDRYIKCLDAGIGKNFDAYLQDLKLAMSPWPFNIDEIKNKVIHVYGELDQSTVHSPNKGETLLKRNNHFLIERYKNHGGSILWTHPEEILLKLLKI